jgi:branched-chain amino acid transport system ATP-binding protein
LSAGLEVEALHVRYGGVRAITDVGLTVGAGEVVGLIGPNGAGKTTFIDAVSGSTRATGTVRLNGEVITDLPPHKRAAKGLARTWQSAEVFEDLTVRENLYVASGKLPLRTALVEVLTGRNRRNTTVDDLLERLQLEGLAENQADSLTLGQRKLLDVGRALVAKPSIVCLDEPAAGLDKTETAMLGHRLREVAQLGPGMLLVDHVMQLVLGVCDRIVVLDFGQVIATGTPDEIRRDPVVIKAYLGAGTAAEESVGS